MRKKERKAHLDPDLICQSYGLISTKDRSNMGLNPQTTWSGVGAMQIICAEAVELVQSHRDSLSVLGAIPLDRVNFSVAYSIEK